MNEATVQDELDFENLPQETKDLVKRLFAADYFGKISDESCEGCDLLRGRIGDLVEEIVELENEIERLERRYDVGYENGYDTGYDAGYEAGRDTDFR